MEKAHFRSSPFGHRNLCARYLLFILESCILIVQHKLYTRKNDTYLFHIPISMLQYKSVAKKKKWLNHLNQIYELFRKSFAQNNHVSWTLVYWITPCISGISQFLLWISIKRLRSKYEPKEITPHKIQKINKTSEIPFNALTLRMHFQNKNKTK